MSDPFETALLEALPNVRRLALKLTRRADQAEDLVQDTVVKALTYRDSFRLGTNMGAWLSLICRNQFYTDKRRSWRWQQMPVATGKGGEEIEIADLIPVPPAALDKLQLDDLLEALGYLPAEQREVLLMAMEGLSYEEMAAELQTEAGTVKSRVSRARSALEIYFSAAAA